MEVQRALLAFADLEDFAAITLFVRDPDFASPALGHNLYWCARAIHQIFRWLLPPPRINRRQSADIAVDSVLYHSRMIHIMRQLVVDQPAKERPQSPQPIRPRPALR